MAQIWPQSVSDRMLLIPPPPHYTQTTLISTLGALV